MRLHAITATAATEGNRISLSWENHDPTGHPGIRVMRRSDAYPVSPTDGVLVVQGTGLTSAVDSGLKGERSYYYTLFPFAGSAPTAADFDEHNHASALATSPFDVAGQMYEQLPALYRRYDTGLPAAAPPVVSATDAARGVLRRLLDLPGGQLDALRSAAQSLLGQHDVDQADGALLPLLAHWIGWQPDHSLGLDALRNELRDAPAVYRRVGLLATLEATVKRVLRRECSTKEYAANVLHSNTPERHTIWVRQRTGAAPGTWDDPAAPFSLDVSGRGRPAVARDTTGTRWLFYHTLRNGRWQVWMKTSPPAQPANEPIITSLAPAASEWGPSQPVSPGPQAQLDPSATAQDARVWLFWSVYDEVSDRWEVRYRTHDAGGWSDDVLFAPSGLPAQRRRPAAASDGSGGVWLFWQERPAGGAPRGYTDWVTRYARHDGTSWSAPVTFPPDAGASPAVDEDLVALAGPAGSGAKLWLFWARREDGTHWRVVYRTKADLAPDAGGWGAITRFSSGPATTHDREPYPVVLDGHVELFLASNRSGTWSVWDSAFGETTGWSAATLVTPGPYAARGPVALPDASRLWLFHGSNRPVVYDGIIDRRYSGSTSVDTRDHAKQALFGRLNDFQTYSYATGHGVAGTNAHRYAYDVVGVFLAPIDLPQQVPRNDDLDQVTQALQAFVPAHVHVLLIDSPD